MTEQELEAAIASDPDWLDEPDWSKAELVIPAAERHFWLRLDPDIAAWFREQGAEAEEQMRSVLRAAMTAKQAKRKGSS